MTFRERYRQLFCPHTDLESLGRPRDEKIERETMAAYNKTRGPETREEFNERNLRMNPHKDKQDEAY